ncbi:hypothetical protein AURDEDRAFT_112026 [Auricularia subglabra TFB-10046 SS5]|nr:hypothetical protein AURDEDRAFT_112026 [Auricularia subglabra TFB-10046 SS5]
MPVSFAFPSGSAVPAPENVPLDHCQEQKRLADAVDDGVDADALEDYLLLKIQCAGARPTSRAQIHEAISSLLQSPTPAPPPGSQSHAHDKPLEPAPPGITRRSSSLLNVLNAVLAPRKLLNKKRKRDSPTVPEPESPHADKRRKILGSELPASPRKEDARRGLLFGLSRVAARRVSPSVDVFGPDGSRTPKRTFAASRSVSSWRLQRAELEEERVQGVAQFGLGIGVFSPTSAGGASPLVGSLMSLVLSPAQPAVADSPARMVVASPVLQTPARKGLAAFRFPTMPSPELGELMVPPLSEVRLPDMAFSPEGLHLSSDSLFGMCEDDTARFQRSVIAFPTLPRFEFACSPSPSPIRFVMPAGDAHLHDEYPKSPRSRLTPSPGPVARPTNPTPEAASSCATDYELSIYEDDEEDEGMGYTFSTDDSAIISSPHGHGRTQFPDRLSTESQDARYAFPTWDDCASPGRSDSSDGGAMLVDDAVFGSPRTTGSGTKWDPRRWHALARMHQIRG